MSRRPVLAISAAAALGAATLVSATPAAAAPALFTIAGIEFTVCAEVTNERKGAATVFLDLVNTNTATATEGGVRQGGATVARPKGNGATRVVSDWNAVLEPGAAASGSVRAQTGDEIAIGGGTLTGGAGAVYALSELPTC